MGAFSIPVNRVKQVLQRITYFRARPGRIRVDSGPEFLSADLVDWCKENEIELQYIQSGKPGQNLFIKRLNANLKKDVLDAWWFEDLWQVRTLIEKLNEKPQLSNLIAVVKRGSLQGTRKSFKAYTSGQQG